MLKKKSDNCFSVSGLDLQNEDFRRLYYKHLDEHEGKKKEDGFLNSNLIFF